MEDPNIVEPGAQEAPAVAEGEAPAAPVQEAENEEEQEAGPADDSE